MIITPTVTPPSHSLTVRSPPLLVSAAAVMAEQTTRPTAFSIYQPQTATAATLLPTGINAGRPSLPQTASLGSTIIFTPTLPHRPIPVSPAVAVPRILPSPTSAFRMPVTSATVTVGHVMDSLPSPQTNIAEHNAHTQVIALATKAQAIVTPVAVEATVVPSEHQAASDSLVDAVMSSLTETLSKATTGASAERDHVLRQTQRVRSSQSIPSLITTFLHAIKPATPTSSSPTSSVSSTPSSSSSERTLTFDECAQLLSLVVNTIESDELLAAHHSCPNCTSSNKGSRWSSSDDTAMLQLIDTGADFPTIAQKLKRTVRALKDRYCLLKKTKGPVMAEHHGHHTSKSADDEQLESLDPPSSASEEKKRSRQRHRSRDHRQRANKRLKLKKRDAAVASSYETDDAHDLSDLSTSDSETELDRHRPPSTAATSTAAVNPPSSTIKTHTESRKSNTNTHSQQNDFMGGHMESTHHHHHHHHHHRRRHSNQLSSPVSPPHLDEMDISTEDDESHSVTSNESSPRSRISHEDESSALDSLTKLSSAAHMADTNTIEKIPYISRQISQTPSLLVALSHM